MLKKVIKVIPYDDTNDFIRLCKKSFRKMAILGFSIVALSALLLYISSRIGLSYEPNIFLAFIKTAIIIGATISSFASFFFILYFMGGMTGGGALFARMDCKTEADWLEFAENHTFLPETLILTKKLELEHKEIVEVLYDSCELRCKDSKSGEDTIIKLGKPFKEEFTFIENKELSENTVVIDLSGKYPVAIVNEI